jgi:hypothetical protein
MIVGRVVDTRRRRARLVGAAAVLVALVFGGLVGGCGRAEEPSGKRDTNQPPSTGSTAIQPDPMANALPVRLTRDFLTAVRTRAGYDRYIHTSLIYTPLDDKTYGWAERRRDDFRRISYNGFSYSGFWEQMNAGQREAALRSVTYGDTVRPETLRFERARFPEEPLMSASGSFSFLFTIQTTTGKTLRGWSLGGAQPQDGGVRGHVDRLTYDLTAG